MPAYPRAPIVPGPPDRFTDVWAIRPARGASAPPNDLPTLDPLADLGLSPAAALALDRDGWVLLQASDSVVERLLRDENVASRIREAVPVYRDPADAEEAILGTTRLLVYVRSAVSDRGGGRALRQAGLEIRKRYAWNPAAWSIRVPEGTVDPFDFARQVARESPGLFRFVMPELRQRFRTRQLDEHQWHLNGIDSEDSPCEPTAHIHADGAWEITKGEGTRIAVIDQAFAYDHPNLGSDVVLDSSAFLSDSAGDDAFGWEVVSPTDLEDHLWHGTACAAMAAAHPTADQGISGSAPQAGLMLIALNAAGTPQDLADAIVYAADPSTRNPDAHWTDGADVISCSLYPLRVASGLPVDDETDEVLSVDPILDAVRMVVRKGRGCRGCPVFWAVSNSPSHPVSDDEVAASKYVFAVGKTNCEDLQPSSGGNAFGAGLDAVAPGIDVYTADVDGGADYQTGTSFATGLTAGVGALVLAANPGLRARRVYKILRRTCDKVGGASADYDPPTGPKAWDEFFGYGRINAEAAVTLAQASL